MGRAYKGPRQLDKTGLWYAVFTPKGGKRLTRSLGTRDRHRAMLLWPQAFRELVAEAEQEPSRPRRGEVYEVWEVPGGMDPSIENLERYGLARPVRAEALFNPEELSISWEDAAEIYRQRAKEKKGQPPSDSWEKGLIAALKVVGDTTPETLTVSDVRRIKEELKRKGNSSSTISNRMSILSTVIEAAIKSGSTSEDLSNPFKRVDYVSPSHNHHETPLEADYRRLADVIGGMSPTMQTTLLLLAYTGLRVGELVSRSADHLEGGWLTITATDSWRPKNRSSEREVPIPEHLQQAFKRIRKWPSLGAIRANTKRIRQELTTHSWRHGWKTAARQGQADEVAAEVLMGHTVGTRMSQVYGVWPREPLMEAALKAWAVLDQWTARN